ncbi:MFS transporter [Virgibacillus pantothenticus]|uniref:Major facilitator transporter n=1 Tax=Virgibacillus pantothenticus TaxID=1473 RepID=A0A0L0QRS2_VIRPA|nr:MULTISPECIES: MFS transporter [Virgibacillus]API92087.1 MFS transporter [Virgibacillus sp. 6R]KNE21299.1 major facilitator transporter [Virgibacillus pantothenticus]MBS7430556.1 MFS transporter [Virgibacillus sp. 19R1-5]MBU8566495.1 MFS transporter [Virgibacillus pantothenticus]MBU8600090.1 MFS transporter [Virgibacillus pantothenticus]
MDKRVYLLTIVSFVVGMVELIIGGILDLVAADLNVSLGKAGLLITIFSLVFAITAPLLMIATAKVERKRLTLIFLLLFSFSNLIVALSPVYSVLFVGRMLSAASGSLLIILCLTIAANIGSEKHRGRAIGFVSMGISGSIVLGVPIGLVLGNAFGWRAPFLFIVLLTLLSMVGVYFLMEKVPPKPQVSIKEQINSLKESKIFSAHSTTFLFMAGHTILYAYFTPFVKETMGISGSWLSVIYFLFGIAAVSGGGVGGTISDRLGTKRTMLTTLIIFSLSIFILPFTTSILPVFIVVMIIWGMMSWAITPALQSYLIESAPATADIQQSLNNSALHFGIAFGSFIGGIVIEQTTVEQNALVGGVFISLSLITIMFSMSRGSKKHKVSYQQK